MVRGATYSMPVLPKGWAALYATIVHMWAIASFCRFQAGVAAARVRITTTHLLESCEDEAEDDRQTTSYLCRRPCSGR
jgi:hypothetical protein